MHSTNSITLPPVEILDAAAAQLLSGATPSQERAINKALWHLQSGIEIRSTTGGFLMPSGTRAGVIHRVSNVHGCGCEAAGKGHTCWHIKALAIIEQAQTRTMPSLMTMPEGDVLDTEGMRVAPLSERLARARREMDELYA